MSQQEPLLPTPPPADHDNDRPAQDNGPNLYDEAYSLTVMACMTHVLGRMRVVARDVLNEEGKAEWEDMGRSEGSDKSKAGKVPAFSPETARQLLTDEPIFPDQIARAIESRGEGAVSFLDSMADFGKGTWAEVNLSMLRGGDAGSIRAAAAEDVRAGPPTWRIVEYSDARSKKELVYAIFVDDVERRVTVGFRASVTSKDWRTNLNMIYGTKKNPVAKLDIVHDDVVMCGIQQPKRIVMHRGFRNYLFQKERNAPNESFDDGESDVEASSASSDDEEEDDLQPAKVKKIHTILSSVAAILSDRPGYALYATGYSLGAGLATVFSLHAASDTRLPRDRPVTCITIGSPKCGTLSFRKAFAALEAAGRLRCLRIINENDPIKEAPLRNMDPKFTFFTGMDYRHVGMALLLNRRGGYSFSYPRMTNSYWRLCWDDDTRTDMICRNSCAVCCAHARGRQRAAEIGDHHGYAEYVRRLDENQGGLREVELDGLYEEAWRGRVPCYACALFCPPPVPKDGDLVLHYY